MTSVKAILKQAKLVHLAADVAKIETGGRHTRRLEVGRDIPTAAEVKALLANATGYTRALLAVAVFCGLRASELRALTWADVDLAERQLHVRQRADKWSSVGALKSGTSYREIPLAPFVLNTLKEWRLARPGELGSAFGNGRGNVESLANIWMFAAGAVAGRGRDCWLGWQGQVRAARLPPLLRVLADRSGLRPEARPGAHGPQRDLHSR